MSGMIFDIEEFSVFDGPGIRTAVFFKGCPLRCIWCHNPEGLTAARQLVKSPNGCISCGRCAGLMRRTDINNITQDELFVCPGNLIRISGEEWDAGALAARLMKNSDILSKAGGGITLSGGEVLSQPEFLLDLLDRLSGVHRAIETSGYGDSEVFKAAIAKSELVIMDIKLASDEMHKRYTGVSNKLILDNLEQLKAESIPFVIRIPLIPGVNDTEENITDTIKLVAPCDNLVRFELLPYNKMAGAKYAMLGLDYNVPFDQNAPPKLHEEIFKGLNITYSIM